MKISHIVWSFLLGVMIVSAYFTSSIAQTQDTTVAQVQDTTITQVQDTTKLGDGFDGNWANPVHLIKLYDDEGDLVTPDEQPLMPFSTKQTCQECHDYNTISKGWHFNYMDPSVPAGRPGEPWVLVNRKSSTQIPLSYRPWNGTFNPDSIGLSRWQFIQDFGRQLPGGGVGEHINPENPDIYMRWLISGDLQINCLACHDASPAHDESEYALQTIHQNFRWAATATAGFARVEGSAADVPNDYDIYRGTVPDDPNVIPPTVHYDKTRWDYNNQVFIDIQHTIPSNNCYFCHSSVNLEQGMFNRWKMDQDVHLTSGMTCVDCHREGLDHNTIRGYQGEPGRENDPYAESLTCEGCHLGD
ncbi:MAG: hypothetical protein P8Y60_19320, partial [Calditrichota bacterium]